MQGLPLDEWGPVDAERVTGAVRDLSPDAVIVAAFGVWWIYSRGTTEAPQQQQARDRFCGYRLEAYRYELDRRGRVLCRRPEADFRDRTH